MPSLSFTFSRSNSLGMSVNLLRARGGGRGEGGFLICPHALYFRKRNHRQEAREEQEHGEEKSDGSGERAHIHICGMECPPGAWQKIARQTGRDNHEAL